MTMEMVMRKAWLASAVMTAALAGLGGTTTSASAGVAGLLSAAQNAAPQDSGIEKVTHRRRYYYDPGYYAYYASPYDYAYYPPPVVYYAVPAPRYVPGPAYYPYSGYYVRPWRRRYYGW
jgi:hypothetical protein